MKIYKMDCSEAEEGVREDCCLHELPGKHEHAPGYVCCWCGLIYGTHLPNNAVHGQYMPRVFRGVITKEVKKKTK